MAVALQGCFVIGSLLCKGVTVEESGDIIMGVGDIMSTPGDVQYTGVSIQIQLFSQ